MASCASGTGKTTAFCTCASSAPCSGAATAWSFDFFRPNWFLNRCLLLTWALQGFLWPHCCFAVFLVVVSESSWMKPKHNFMTSCSGQTTGGEHGRSFAKWPFLSTQGGLHRLLRRSYSISGGCETDAAQEVSHTPRRACQIRVHEESACRPSPRRLRRWTGFWTTSYFHVIRMQSPQIPNKLPHTT